MRAFVWRRYSLLQNQGKLTEPWARLYIGELALAFYYFSQLQIVYRDLKPENILVTSVGHIRLADFDLSQVADSSKPVQMAVPFNAEAAQHGALPDAAAAVLDERSIHGGSRFNSFVGTVEYCAPEVIEGTGHSFGVDHWVLGVLIYVSAATSAWT